MSRSMVRLYLILEMFTQGGKAFHSGIYVMFLLSRGLSLFEASLVNTFYAATLIVAEFPTGIIADVWGRKISFIVSCFVTSLGLLIYAYAPSFWWFVLAEAVIAIGSTCATGAFQAWIVDTLEHEGTGRIVNRVFVRTHQLRKIVTVVSVVLGAYTADYFGFMSTWIVGAVAFAVAGALTVFAMREDYFVRSEKNFSSHLTAIRAITGSSLRYAFKTPSIRFMLLVSFVSAFAVQPWNMQWQPFFAPYFGKTVVLGWIFVGVALFSLTGITLARKFVVERRMVLHRIITANQLAIAVVMFIAASVPWAPVALIFFLVHEIGRGAYGVFNDAFMNARIPSGERASLLSIGETMGHIGMMLGLLVSGYMSDSLSIGGVWVCFSVFLVFASIFVARFYQNERRGP